MDTQQLKIFLEVVRQGSFAAAARRLDLDASAVTRSVAAMETELGVRLMHRTTRRMSLTEAGSVFYEHAASAFTSLDKAFDEARSNSGELEGLVRVTASVSFGQKVLVPLMPQLHTLHPRLEVELVLTDSIVDLIAGQADIALRLGNPPDGSLIGVPLRSVRYRVCASPAYLKAHGRPRRPADLAECDCLRFPLPGYRTQWKFRDRQGSTQAVDVGGWLVLSTALALHQAALDALGPALLADWVVEPDLGPGRLIDLFPEFEATATDFSSSIWLLYPSRVFLPRRVRSVVDFFREKLGSGSLLRAPDIGHNTLAGIRHP